MTPLQGIVYRKSTGIYHVHTSQGRVVPCAISSRLRKRLVYPTRDRSSLPHFRVVDVEDITTIDPVAIGDQVIFTDAGDGTGLITEILARHTQLTRRAAGAIPREQVIVANADQMIAVLAAAQPSPKGHLLDRYLASAEASEVSVIVCLTKMDLVRGKRQERDILTLAGDYSAIGYRVILTSAATGEGVEELREALAGKLSVLIGKSGVGKSTLLNAIEPGLGLRVGEVNVHMDKGRHTTTHLEMFPLATGGSIVDTPGMKTFGLWNVPQEEIPLLFREFREHLGRCRFAGCAHDHEPGCAIKRAVEEGWISAPRYQSYLHLRDHIYAEEK
jgi:ribosome biogenesis GTPase